MQKTLEKLLETLAFEHLRSPVNAKYSRYLPMKTGLFLSHLKERHDPFYREFLNPYGDEKYGTFRAEETRETEKQGILIVVVNRGLYQALNSTDILRTTINNRLGRIGPDDCLLSGDPSGAGSMRCSVTIKKRPGCISTWRRTKGSGCPSYMPSMRLLPSDMHEISPYGSDCLIREFFISNDNIIVTQS